MNAIQKVIKYGAMAFAVMLSISIMGAIVTFLFGIMVGVEKETKSATERNSFSQEYTKEMLAAEKVDTLWVDFSGKITIKPGEVFKIEAVDVSEDFAVECRNGKITIKEREDNSPIQWVVSLGEGFSWDQQVTITVPSDLELKLLEVNSGSGKVSVEEIKTKSMVMDSGSGSVEMRGVSAAETSLNTGSGSVTITDSDLGKAKLDSGSGKVKMQQVIVMDADVKSGSGKVEFEGELTGDCDFDTGSGSVQLTIKGSEEEYRVEAECGSGSFRLNGKKIDDGIYGRNVKGEISVDSGSGAVSIEFTELMY